MTESGSICLLPRLEGLGGPASFQGRLIEGLKQRGLQIHHDPLRSGTAAILVIGGPRRHLWQIWQARQRGVRVVQRLNGMNWVHRKRQTGWKHYLRSEVNNRLLAFVRSNLADRIVYQSQFAQNWWQTMYGSTRAPGRVIYNGVDLKIFSPDGSEHLPDDHLRVLMVEGHLGGGYEQGLANAVRLVSCLQESGERPVELAVAGDVPRDLKERCQAECGIRIDWSGVVERHRIPSLDRSAHVLFSADLNAACPNSVIEAMACGLPVTGFATGSLPELLEGGAGRCAPYGTNFWALEPPEMEPLVEAAREILCSQDRYRPAARARAESVFGLDRMVDLYLKVLL